MGSKKRINWGKNFKSIPQMDLISIQKDSWKDFLVTEFKDAIHSISPISDYTGNNWELELADIDYDPAQITPQIAKQKGLNYTIPVKVHAKLTNKRTSSVREEDVFFLNLPAMTSEGTFIINGIERGVINQLVRSPGIYFTGENDAATGKILYNSEIRPLRGSWLEFFIGKKDVIFARIDRRRKFPATILLKAVCDMDNKQLIAEFGDFITDTIQADPTTNTQEAVLEFYRRLRPGEPVVLDTAQKFLNDRFFNLRTYELGQVGRYKINRRFEHKLDDSKEENWILTQEDLVATLKHLIKLQKGEETQLDDIDSLANRRLRRCGEIVSRIALRPALSRFERMIKERMSLISTKEKPSPSQMINPQPLISSLNSFFRSNQLSSILDQTNPLSEVDVLRRVTVVGIGGLSRERAAFSIRDVHHSQYGRICAVRSPEGPNIGLVTYLALYSKVDSYGFILAPFRKVKKIGNKYKITDDIVYLDAQQEYDIHATHLGVNIDEKGFIKDKRVPIRYQGEFIEGPVSEVEYADLIPNQIVGTSASLIPFVDHDDATRALMGSHMQTQAVPLVKPDAPIVGTGMEKIIATAMNRSIVAQRPGQVKSVDGQKIVIKLNKKTKNSETDDLTVISRDGMTETYPLVKFERTSPHGTCYNQVAVVNVGDKVKAGDLLADGPSTQGGELALGQNVLVAYASIDGLTYEDSILISDRLVKQDIFTSIQIYEYSADLVDTKLGPEELTKDIPNVSDNELSKLTQDGIVMIGATVGPNDILVGKVEPRGEKELTAEERLLRAIFGEKAREVKDTSLRVPNGEGGVVIRVDTLDKDEGDELNPGVNKIVKVYVAQIRRIQEGDKIAGRHGNKGVVCRIMPEYDMPHLPDGTPIDLAISPLSVVSRMNLGQVLETTLAFAGQKLDKKYAVPVFEKHSEAQIAEQLTEAGLPVSTKSTLIDGRTGKVYDQDILVGTGYILKLVHMVDDKVHSRSTGPYSLVTQQPLGGKARMGGQRLGEMEVWALEAHRADHTLREMLTIKSDDIEGRTAAFQAIIKGETIPEPDIPESFKVLVNELAGLGLNVTPTGVVKKSEAALGVDKENKKDKDKPDLKLTDLVNKKSKKTSKKTSLEKDKEDSKND